MQNPKPVQESRNNAAPETSGAANINVHAANKPHENQSPESHSHDHAPNTNDQDDQQIIASPPTAGHQMYAPPPHQSHKMTPAPPPPPFLPPSMMQLPPPHHFHMPPYPNHPVIPIPSYAYPMIFPSAPPPPNMLLQIRPWSTGLCCCFSDPKNCFITAFCPCLTFGQVSEILNEGHTPWWEGAVAYILLEIATLSMGTFFCAWTYRAKMRRKHLLDGNHFRDLIVSLFFTRLTLCQLYRQLDHLGYNVPLGWIANKEGQIGGGMGNGFQAVPPAVESGMFR